VCELCDLGELDFLGDFFGEFGEFCKLGEYCGGGS
jgi:hypothetical protein